MSHHADPTPDRADRRHDHDHAHDHAHNHDHQTQPPAAEAPLAAARGRLRVVAPPAVPIEELAGEEAPLRTVDLGPMDLELGGRLEAVTLAYRTWGRLSLAGDNAVLVLHALTGDSRAAGGGGWWDPLIGPGRAIDTDRAFVLCANVLGGCQGSTGPATIDPLTDRPYGMRFPLITIGDIVAAQRRLVEALGVTRLVAVGGSIGGFQALEWATRHPDLVGAAIPVAAGGALDPQGVAMNEIGRRAIMADPNWRGGAYASEGVHPDQGLAMARMVGMMQYHSKESMALRFGRAPATRPGLYPSFGPTFDIEGYLHYHGAALVRRFDANAYLYLTRAMDLYDVGRDGGEARWLAEVAAPTLLIGIRSDWLFGPGDVRALHGALLALGKEATYTELDSPHGHDAFLKEWGQMTEALRSFVDRALPADQDGRW